MTPEKTRGEGETSANPQPATTGATAATRATPAKAAPAPVTGEPRPAAPMPAGSFTATHEVLFAPEVATCDACDGPLTRDPDDDEDEDGAGGHGLYVWIRHGTVVYEEPPLCHACATAITITALRGWDIEEEEG